MPAFLSSFDMTRYLSKQIQQAFKNLRPKIFFIKISNTTYYWILLKYNWLHIPLPHIGRKRVNTHEYIVFVVTMVSYETNFFEVFNYKLEFFNFRYSWDGIFKFKSVCVNGIYPRYTSVLSAPNLSVDSVILSEILIILNIT